MSTVCAFPPSPNAAHVRVPVARTRRESVGAATRPRALLDRNYGTLRAAHGAWSPGARTGLEAEAGAGELGVGEENCAMQERDRYRSACGRGSWKHSRQSSVARSTGGFLQYGLTWGPQRLSTRGYDSCVPAGCASTSWRLDLACINSGASEHPRNDRVRVPHFTRLHFVASPHEDWHLRNNF